MMVSAMNEVSATEGVRENASLKGFSGSSAMKTALVVDGDDSRVLMIVSLITLGTSSDTSALALLCVRVMGRYGCGGMMCDDRTRNPLAVGSKRCRV